MARHPKCFKTHREYLDWYAAYRARNRKKIRTYNREWMRDYRAKGRKHIHHHS